MTLVLGGELTNSKKVHGGELTEKIRGFITYMSIGHSLSVYTGLLRRENLLVVKGIQQHVCH